MDLKATVTFTGDGSTKKFYFNFDYINKQFIKVTVDGTLLSYPTDYTVVDKAVELKVAPESGKKIKVYRETPTERIIEWTDGGFIKANQLKMENIQELHILEEQHDFPMLHSITNYPSGKTYNAMGEQIGNVADPTEPNHVVTKKYMEEVQNGFVEQNKEIVKNVQSMESNAADSKDKAQKWAMSPDSPDGKPDTGSDTGKTKSAKEWARDAREAETQAKQHADDAYRITPDGLKWTSNFAVVDGKLCVIYGGDE